MEDLPIEPGICASRIRCYTEGAMQRPSTFGTGRSYRAGKGTLYKSASSLHLVKNATGEDKLSSTNQRKLCKSCDQLPRGSKLLGRTFVSSVNIALAKPEPTRKMSLPHHLPVFHHQRDSPNVELSSSSLSISQVNNSDSNNKMKDKQENNNSFDTPVNCLEKNTSGNNPDENELPWEINNDFPHIPVLERIKEFEKQTGAPNSLSSSPGRWKHKGKTNRNKSSRSVHSSPAMSRKNSVDEKVIVRNSRNSSPAILHLHTEMQSLEQGLTSRVCEIDPSKSVTTSDLTVSNVTNVTVSPQVVLCEQESLTKSKEALELRESTTPNPVSEKGPSETKAVNVITESTNSLTGNKVIDSSNAISVEAKLMQERTHIKLQSSPCLEQLLLENNSMESTPEVLVDLKNSLSKHVCHNSLSDETEYGPTACFETPDIECAIHDKDTHTCVSSKLCFVKNTNVQESTATDQEFKDHQEISVLADHNFGQGEEIDNLTKCETSEITVEVTSASEEDSEKLLTDSSEDCQPATSVLVQRSAGSMMDSISEVEARSSKEENLDIQCNRPDLPECVTAQTDHCQSDDSLEEPLPVQPLIDEIFQAGNSIDTDVYSQRCSQQLGECGSESAVLQSTHAGGLATGLLIGPSPCLSDCYSSSNGSSDDETQITDRITLSDLNPNAMIDVSIKLSEECNMSSTGTCSPPLSDSNKEVPVNDCLDPEALQDSKSEEVKDKEPLGDRNAETVCSSLPSQEEMEESTGTDSDQYTDDLPSSTCKDEVSDSFDCIREVLASNQLPDLSSSLGACGGLPPLSTGAASDNAARFSSSDKSAFSRHLSALIGEQQCDRGAGMAGDGQLNVDQALFLSRVNLLLGWIHNQQSRPAPPCIQAPVPSLNVDKKPSEGPSNIKGLSCDVSNTKQALNSPVHKENEPPQVLSQTAVKQKEIKEVHIKPQKRSRQKKYINPDKVSHLRYLILQSPLVLYDWEDSDSDESDVELNEFGEVKQDYPLGRLPDYIVAQIFSNLVTKDLAALKCACKDFKWLIERFDIKSTDSRWSEEFLYREDPCMQCGKIRDPRGDVSLCRWHPKIYYKNGEIGRHYWTCCFASEEDAPGCETSLHDNKWSGSHSRLCKVPRSWRQYWRSYPMDS